jgi:hypothetical protein
VIKILLTISSWIRKEPCSLQKELINRSKKQRALWDLDNQELLELYSHLDDICKKRTGVGSITPKEFFTLLKYPRSALNFLSGRKVPFNDLESFKSEF